MKKLAITTAIAAFAIAALTGCGDNTSNTIANAPAAAAASGTTAPDATPGAAKFGQKVTFPSGVSVTVTPKVQTSGQYASGAVEGKIVYFAIKITNGSKAPIDGFLISMPDVTYGATGIEAKTALDFEAKSGSSTVKTVLPGETQTAQAGFGIPSKEFGNVRVEVRSADMSEQPAIFKGSVK